MTFKNSKKRVARGLLALSLGISALSVHAGPRTAWSEIDYWEETQLSFSTLINGLVSDTNCKTSVKKLVACVAVLNKMHDFENPTNQETIVLDFKNGLSFKKVSSNEKSIKNYLIELRDYLETSISESALVLLEGSFSEALEDFVDSTVKEANDSFLAAQLYNTYLTVAVDPHSYISPANKMRDSSQAKTDNKGIGVFLETYTVNQIEKILVTEVIENSPAEKAGMKVGDIILNVNISENFQDMMDEIRKRDVFDITVLRNNANVSLTITKGIYTVVNVKSKKIQSGGNSYGYIKLRTFSDPTGCKNIKKSIQKFKEDSNFKGVILDLRNNGGGLVTQAICIMKTFLEPGSITWMTKDLSANELVYDNFRPNKFNEMLQGLHNVVLVNGYSASASEAVSMYLQDYQKAFIVGERSFGKGSMQGLYEFKDPSFGENATGIVTAQTSALYYGPKGASPQVDGVVPDINSRPKHGQLEDTEYLREEDRYAFPILDREFDKTLLVNDKRVRNVSEISNCLSQRDEVSRNFERGNAIEQEMFDNQLETAIATLNCANDKVQVHRGINIKQATDLEIISVREQRLRSFRRLQQEDQERMEEDMKQELEKKLKEDLENGLKPESFKLPPIQIPSREIEGVETDDEHDD